jgi:hypothetical protein
LKKEMVSAIIVYQLTLAPPSVHFVTPFKAGFRQDVFFGECVPFCQNPERTVFTVNICVGHAFKFWKIGELLFNGFLSVRSVIILAGRFKSCRSPIFSLEGKLEAAWLWF